MTDFATEREAMIERQLRRRGILDEHVLTAFREVPREAFVPVNQKNLAYGDHPLPIEAGQTISQPYVVALMIQSAGIGPAMSVLEVGAGSGYAAAVLGRIATRVIGVEREPALAELARERMRHLGYDNVEIVDGDGSRGWSDGAPYDAILAAASGSHVPESLIDQLAPGGTLVMPVGNPDAVQRLVQVKKSGDGSLQQSELGAVRFVPLIGEEGWSDARG